MTKKERVETTIAHKKPDKVPRGELAIESGLRDSLLKDSSFANTSNMAKENGVRALLGMDLVNIHEFPIKLLRYDSDGYPIYESAFGDHFKDMDTSMHIVKPALDDIEEVGGYEIPDIGLCTTNMLDYYRENSDFYLFSQINGPISALCWMLGIQDGLCACVMEPEHTESLALKLMAFEFERAKVFLNHGSDAIMITDDIAFNTGLFLPPRVMDKIGYPIYKEIVFKIKQHRNVPVFFHSDGYIMDALPYIIQCGFDGLHSIQPSAGMNIEKVAHEYGDKLCLMGNIDLDYLLPFGSPSEVKREAKRLFSLFTDGGFILSSCNILTNSVKPENALAMYSA